MSCSCTPPDRTPLWAPIPEYRQPTQIQVGENLDCYMRRAGSVSGLKNDIGGTTPNLINNTSLTSDLNGNVNVTFKLTPSSTRTATGWQIAVNGSSGLSPLTELSFNTLTGLLSGTVSGANANKLYKVLIEVNDGSGFIDSREFNFYPKIGTKSDTVQLVFPLVGTTSSEAHVTCAFGPRTPPAPGASTQHNGIDIAMVDHSQGFIVAAGDGVVTKAGPAIGFGNWIVIEHRDSQENLVATTIYGHMNDGNIYVTVGQLVSAGQKIALEGNAGIGTGMHLHFEVHKGSWRNPVDPMAYLNGTTSVAIDNDPAATVDGDPAPTGFENITNSNAGLTTGETAAANADCPPVLPQDTAVPVQPDGNPPTPPTNNINSHRSACAPAITPDAAEVISAIQSACASDVTLTPFDAKFIQSVATIESSLDPFAKNPTSSATGLYQMLDATAVHYYGIIGVPPTCANRCDSTLATRAYIAFYKTEILPFWTAYQADSTKIAGKSIVSTAWSSQFPNLNQGDFQYGLVHHDGVGNAAAGRDLGGVAYWRSRVT